MSNLCSGKVLFSDILCCSITMRMYRFINVHILLLTPTEPQRMILFSHDGGVAVLNPSARVASPIFSLAGVDSFGYIYQDGVRNNYPYKAIM